MKYFSELNMFDWSGQNLPVNQQKFTEWNFPIFILIDFSDHCLQTEMCLWCLQFFHHELQFGQIQETILTDIISERERENKFYLLLK